MIKKKPLQMPVCNTVGHSGQKNQSHWSHFIITSITLLITYLNIKRRSPNLELEDCLYLQ